MRSITSLLVASASLPFVASQYGNPSGIYPNTTYPDAVSEDPVVIAGSKEFQASPPGKAHFRLVFHGLYNLTISLRLSLTLG